MDDYKISWKPAKNISEREYEEYSSLFNENYGTWSSNKQPVKRTSSQLKGYLKAAESWVANVNYCQENKVIGYAFFYRLHLENKGYVTWVTQFVIRKEHRNKGLGTRLLRAIWSQSNQYAWGLVTANPFAIRSLEKATLRTCDFNYIQKEWSSLHTLISDCLEYVTGCPKMLRTNSTAINTNFFLDRAPTIFARNELSNSGKKWTLGELEDGEEWVAFTFREQAVSKEAPNLVKTWISDCDYTVKNAYGYMSLDENHKWNKHTEHEIDMFVNYNTSQNSLIFDVGCGNGRHSIELAKRNFRVVGVDFTEELIECCKKNAKEQAENYQNNLEFICVDIREYKPEKQFDYAICLYDVIGSFASQEDNIKVLKTIFNSLKKRGKLLLSVMNGELSRSKARHIAKSENELFEQLLTIEPSNTMASTGNIFNPMYYIWCDGVAYRKEQFESDFIAPCELIVRDRRYSKDELIGVLNEVGFDVISAKYVKTADWSNELDALNDRAKEILLLCEKN